MESLGLFVLGRAFFLEQETQVGLQLHRGRFRLVHVESMDAVDDLLVPPAEFLEGVLAVVGPAVGLEVKGCPAQKPAGDVELLECALCLVADQREPCFIALGMAMPAGIQNDGPVCRPAAIRSSISAWKCLLRVNWLRLLR